MKKKKNQNKGQKGYLAWNKKMSICKTLVLFAISFAVYATIVKRFWLEPVDQMPIAYTAKAVSYTHLSFVIFAGTPSLVGTKDAIVPSSL